MARSLSVAVTSLPCTRLIAGEVVKDEREKGYEVEEEVRGGFKYLMAPRAIEVNDRRHRQLKLTVKVHSARSASQRKPR